MDCLPLKGGFSGDMIDARDFSVDEILRNGLEVRIRSLRPDDEERIVEGEISVGK